MFKEAHSAALVSALLSYFTLETGEASLKPIVKW